jgi:hypothetical protein
MGVLICPTHGASRSNPTGFCKLCGARLIISDAQLEAPARQSNTFIWLGIIIALLLIGLIVLSILVFNGFV